MRLLVPFLVLLLAFLASAGALAAAGDIALASTSDTGTKGNSISQQPSLSGDGTRVAFFSQATNLDPGDADIRSDIYVKDVVTGDITLASTSDSGTKGDFGSEEPSLSADGNVVAFTSNATNLDPGDGSTGADVYVKNLVNGDIVLASTSDGGVTGNDSSFAPTLSEDGTRVAFLSNASNLDPADTDGLRDVYVKDLVSGDIKLASTSDGGTKGVCFSTSAGQVPSLSADGTVVAFSSCATTLDPGDTSGDFDIYVKDLDTGNIILASTADTGVKGSGDFASLSGDGTMVAFNSGATNLDSGDTDTVTDVYVKDLATDDITLVSTSDGGTKGNGGSLRPSLTADGTKVAFQSNASNLDPDDGTSGPDIYVKDLGTGDLALASTSSSGVKGNSGSTEPSASSDGTEVAFQSNANNLDPGDTDTTFDVYVKELLPVNTAPVAEDDAYAVDEDTTLSVTAPGVLDNDGDAEDDSLTAVLVDGPLNAASFSLSADGSFDYTPDEEFSGTDGFTYRANDGELDSSVATVTITVDPVNDPSVVRVVGGSCLSNTAAQGSLELMLDDVDDDEADLSVTATSSNQTLLPDGNLVVSGTGAERSLTLTAAPNKSGVAVVSVVADDGENASTFEVSVKVGGKGNDSLSGSTWADVLFGLGGVDALNGEAGNDLLCGGQAVDTVNGGDGDDVLDGGQGNDSLDGGEADDTLLGKAGDDSLTGGSGGDVFSGGSGVDVNRDFNAAEGDTTDGT
jgi:hypothetical protein